MNPVKQTKRGGPDVPPEERGDCFSACLASLLEVPIDAVPIPHSDDADVHWWDVAQEAMARHGYRLVMIDPSQGGPDVHWIAAVPSLNLGHWPSGAKVMHVVVMHCWNVVHDPSLGKRYPLGALPDDVMPSEGYVLVPLEIRSLAA